MRFYLLIATLLAMLLGTMAVAATAPMVRGTVVRDYARVTFEWPSPARIKSSASGKTVTLTFDRSAGKPDFGALLSRLSPYITHASVSGDGKTVSLSLNKPYKIRNFVSGNLTGVDIMGIDSKAPLRQPESAPKPTPKPTPEPIIAKKPETPPAPKAEKEKPAVSKPVIEKFKPVEVKPSEVKKPEKTPKEKMTELPAIAGLPEVNKQKTPEELIKEAVTENKKALEALEKEKAAAKPAPIKKIDTAKKPEEKKEEKKENIEKKAETVPTAATVPVLPPLTIAPTDTPPTTEEETVEETPPPAPAPMPEAPVATTDTPLITSAKPATAGEVSLAYSETKDGVKLFFPWKERVGAVMFQRNGMVWVVFSKKKPLDISALTTTPSALMVNPQLLPHKEYSILRFSLSKPLNLFAGKMEDGNGWSLELTSRLRRPKAPVKLSWSTQPPLKPHIFLPVLESAEPVTITDPDIGDELILAPFFETGQAIWPLRKFVDCVLLETAQGMAIQKIDDTTRVALLRNGMRVTKPEGLQISSEIPELVEEDPALYGEVSDTMFPYARWALKPGEKYTEVETALRQKIVTSRDEETTNLYRLKLAQIRMALGMMQDALGELEFLESTAPVFFLEHNLAALKGAAKFHMYRLGEAAQDFAAPELIGNKEAGYWKDALAYIQGDTDATFDFMTADREFFNKYPPALRQRLAIFAAEKAINNKKFNTALQIFDRLNKDKQLAGVQNYVNFMVGKISAESGQVAAGIKIFEELKTRYNDPFVRTQASLAHAIYRFRLGKITRDEAIDELEALRFLWRDDTLELNILNVLADLYQEKPDYIKALRTMRDITLVFPTSPEALTARQEMTAIFRTLFYDGLADKMQPVEALALFREFQDLTPVGKEGEELYRKIADRLVGVDLLDEAAGILQQQVRYRLEGEERSRIGARLALIHLLNRQPDMALDVLETTGFGNNTDALSRTRNQLTAKALIDLKKYPEALAMVQDDLSDNSQEVRLDAYWKSGDWKNVIATAEEILGNRKDGITAPLTEKQGQYLLQLALAYSLERDQVGLQYLRDYFTPLAKDTKSYNAFAFVTENHGVVDHKNFDMVAKEAAEIESFLAGYRERIAKDGLSAAVQ